MKSFLLLRRLLGLLLLVISLPLATQAAPWFAYVQVAKDRSETLRVAAMNHPSAPSYGVDGPIADRVTSDSTNDRTFSNLTASPDDRFLAARMNEINFGAMPFVDWFVRVYSMKTGRVLVSMNEHAFKDMRQAVHPLPALATYAASRGYALSSLDYLVEVEGADIREPAFRFNTDGTLEIHFSLWVSVVSRSTGRVFDELGYVTFKHVYGLTDTAGTFLGYTSSRTAASAPSGVRRIGTAFLSGKRVVALDGTPLPFSITLPLQYRSADEAAGYIR